jgi:SagB-type dehydrogenase family enzyme
VPPSPSAVHRYHDGTKHHFHQFARSLGYLDWASQPNPFRSYSGSPAFPLYPRLDAPDVGEASGPFRPIGDLLRHSLGLSAWKQFRGSRWSLRVNPSSGNLHPTEAYVVCAASPGLAAGPAIYHYAADRHELELRCEFERDAWQSASAGEPDIVLVALTSIHWREAWKYGERAFRYCQHDLGHAVAAVSLAAAIAGWRARMLPEWSHRAIATLVGLDRDDDFVEAEREDPGCILALTRAGVPGPVRQADDQFVAAVRDGRWSGRATQLSGDHVQWTFIDEIAQATEDPGHATPASGRGRSLDGLYERAILLQRRSAVSLDGQSATDRATLLTMLSRVMSDARPPWDALWWTPRIHLVLFVHRVDDLAPGLYLLVRREGALEALRGAAGGDCLWERADGQLPLYCLARGDCRSLAQRLSCDQAIAADGFFSVGMIAEFEASLQEHGPSFYRHLFWESGVVGQVMYLEAEAAGARATGIGCFYDDPVHDVLGLRDHAFQSLYHFTVGVPVEDTRLTTEPGYAWEEQSIDADRQTAQP